LSTLQSTQSINKAGSASQAWLRALELTAPIPRNPNRVMSTAIEELALRVGDCPALLSERESMTYRTLSERMHQYARWALDEGIAHGEVVCLLMTNRPEYLAAWLGITSVGCVVSLLNTSLPGPALAHCINVVQPKQLIVAAEFSAQLSAALPQLSPGLGIWTHGDSQTSFPRIDLAIDRKSCEALDAREQRTPTITDRALYIYTSGTTGLPKAANVTHARILQWSRWFAGLMAAQPEDKMYNCLPMYHSVGGVLAPGAILVAGGSLVIREKFSASHFWTDIARWDCTIFQYIGELCRYLLHAPPSAQDTAHHIRIACGNGLAAEVWDRFKERFNIPQVLEFYAATEGGVSLFNVQGKPGAIGHIPGYLAHRFAPAVVKFDVEQGEPVRDAQGYCIRCAVNEAGEALGQVAGDAASIGSRFEGYTDKAASEKKILRDVFEPGDAWVRTGDLMRKDPQGYFYFVDRIGDTFRWKGENVATIEVAEALCAFPGVKHANVYGVTIPSTEGRAGMAAIVTEVPLDLTCLRRHLASCLPAYARPLFLRLRNDVEVTGTFKYSKTELVRQGYDPSASSDLIFFDHPESGTFTSLSHELYQSIQAGGIRV
jgi:fatty-acyl-CoA synthase